MRVTLAVLILRLRTLKIPWLNICFLLSICLPATASSQWYVQQVPTSEPLTGVYFGDTLNGWVTSLGGLFRTTDGGFNWSLVDSAAAGDVAGVGTNVCWAKSATRLLRTTDAGSSWMITDFDTVLPGLWGLLRISLLDTARGWITARTRDNMTWILRTKDGGSTWEKFPVTAFYVTLCSFVDSTHGWVAGNSSYVFRTTDGGSTWDSSLVYAYELKMDLQFVETSRGWITSDGPDFTTAVFGTSDGGRNWNGLLYFECSALSTYLYFTDTTNGWVVQSTCLDGSYVEILHTANGGVTWMTQYKYYPTSYFAPRRVFFLDTLHGWIVGEGGIILHTTTGGTTDTRMEADDIPNSITLYQNYPNPLNPTTTISYELPRASDVVLSVYDILGNLVSRWVEARHSPGRYSRVFNASHLASGVYVCRLQAGAYDAAIKLVVLK